MSQLVPCTSCGRHLRADTTCPFCAAPTARLPGAFRAVFGAVLTPMMLAACYGAPPCDDKDLVDEDGDGFSTTTTYCNPMDAEDCDDTDAAVHPGATEVACDGVDQDCDGSDVVDTGDTCDSGGTTGTR